MDASDTSVVAGATDAGGGSTGASVVESPAVVVPTLQSLRSSARSILPDNGKGMVVFAKKDELSALMEGADKGGSDKDMAITAFMAAVGPRVPAPGTPRAPRKPKAKPAAGKAEAGEPTLKDDVLSITRKHMAAGKLTKAVVDAAIEVLKSALTFVTK